MLGQSAGPPPGWKTRTHKRYISKDRVLLKQLESAIKGDDPARKRLLHFNFYIFAGISPLFSGLEASLALRRHFYSRSAQVITPVARYLNSLIPSPSEVRRVRVALGFPQSAFPSPSHSNAIIPSSSTTPSLSASVSQSSFSSSTHTHSRTSSLRAPSSTTGNSPFLSPASSPSVTVTDQNHTKPSTPIRRSPGLRLKPFNNANFFASLKTHGSLLPFKSSSKRTEFYERSVNCLNCCCLSIVDLLLTQFSRI